MKKDFFKNLFIMSRPPFHIVGVLPFVLGAVMAYRVRDMFSWPVFSLSVLAVISIMLCTYYNGEYYDIKEDKLTAEIGKNPFSGGSQVIAQKMLPRKTALTASFISLSAAVVIGLVLQFVFKTGPLTIPLGMTGIFFGFFYSSPPFRWVSRGIGEIMIGFCYGWLPINVSYYLQTQEFLPLVSWVSIPVGLSIFNVILINEFPDYDADRMAGKRNLVVRLGRNRSSFIYVLSSVLAWAFFVLTLFKGIPLLSLYVSIPFILASVYAATAVLSKKYKSPGPLAVICGLTILVNIGISLSYIIGIAAGGIA
ncbi:MAG: prenyltransferase [Actinomycetota bacterium]